MTIKISQFFENEYVDFSAYDNVRKIGSYLDGLKNASRKIIFTLTEQNIEGFVKVANLGPKVQDFSQYLHGSLEGTIVNMTADYVGSGNNVSLLVGDGNFGSRFIPQAAATRYIFAKTSPLTKKIFLREDNQLLEKQFFEGDRIEPKYFMPALPMILVNGSEGVSIGFAQKILPRDPKQIQLWVQQKAKGEKITADLTPHWVGQDFVVESGEEEAQWVIKGKVEKVSANRVRVTSLPVGMTLKNYHDVLDKLVDNKVIRDYEDRSDEDVFDFEIVADKTFAALPEEKLLDKLKLVKRVSENFTCVDGDNKIIQFSNANELLERWYEARIEMNGIRKEAILSRLASAKEEANAKAIFIQGVVDGDIELRNRKESEIISDGEHYNDNLKGRMEKLISLPMRSLTSEEIRKQKNKIKEIETEIKTFKKLTLENISIEDAEAIKF